MTFPTAEDKKLLGTRQYWDIMNYQGHGFVPITRMQYAKEDCEAIIQQILSEHIKAEKYDSLMKANSEIVQNNIDITKEHEIVERLKAEINRFEQIVKTPSNRYRLPREEDKIYDILKSILENKP